SDEVVGLQRLQSAGAVSGGGARRPCWNRHLAFSNEGWTEPPPRAGLSDSLCAPSKEMALPTKRDAGKKRSDPAFASSRDQVWQPKISHRQRRDCWNTQRRETRKPHLSSFRGNSMIWEVCAV